MPYCSIIILNWNKYEDTKKCLQSLSLLAHKDFEVILIDNGSRDGSPGILKDHLTESRYFFPIRFIENEKNLGFTGGNIEGLKICHGQYIILLNNDVVVDPQWLSALVKRAQEDPKIGVVGGRAYIWDSHNASFDKNNPYYSYQVINPWTGSAETLMNQEGTQFDADSISGCAVLIKRKLIDEIGFLEPVFFAYYEETDLFARAIRNGYKIVYEPKACVWHQIAKSAGPDSYFYFYHMYRNRIIFAIRNFDQPYYKRLIKDFFAQGLIACGASSLSFFMNERFRTIIRAKFRAFLWIIVHWRDLHDQRRSIISKGFYNHKIFSLKKETVSVIIVNYNYKNYVGRAILSALEQTIRPHEIIVVDDGSTDDSIGEIKKYSVTLLAQNNQGVIAARNNGFRYSTGKFILFLDADDTLRNDAIERYLEAYYQNTSCDFFYSDMNYCGFKNGTFKSRPFNRVYLRWENYIHNSALIKREAFESAGGYKANMGQGYEDWDLYLSMVEKGSKGKYIPEALLNYYKHASNQSRNDMAKYSRMNLFQNVLNNHRLLYSAGWRHIFQIRFFVWKWREIVNKLYKRGC
ncbi:MAG: glycosyltransferase family 2 protein [Candidatus Omnitrophica bacterium]|nr:glycosyltransferase family 2 protein [Candidatus Omnitrophota bacterium]